MSSSQPFEINHDNGRQPSSSSSSLHKPWLQCSFPGCSYRTQRQNALTRHVDSHTVRPINDRLRRSSEARYSQESSKQEGDGTSIRMTDDGRWQCPFCDHKTPHKGDIINHTRIHTGERPYICEVLGCNYASAKASTLNVHRRRWHPAPDERKVHADMAVSTRVVTSAGTSELGSSYGLHFDSDNVEPPHYNASLQVRGNQSSHSVNVSSSRPPPPQISTSQYNHAGTSSNLAEEHSQSTPSQPTSLQESDKLSLKYILHS